MRKTVLTIAFVLLASSVFAQYPIDPVPFTSVKVEPASFWGHRLKASREVTIPLAFSKCEETGRYDNFVKAAQQMNADHNLLRPALIDSIIESKSFHQPKYLPTS